MSKINFIHGDCMELMASKPDKYYDFVFCDPPYGINAEQGTNRASRKQFANKKYGWDNKPPDKKFFIELIRVSKNQIIFGANHFIENIPDANSKSWFVWNKLNPDRCFADAELIWGSNIDNVRIIELKRVQELNKKDGGKIHPTQKPVQLYRWFSRYIKPGDLILDTHGGSMSSAIACDMEGFDLDICELDKEYFDAAVQRFNTYKSQLKLF